MKNKILCILLLLISLSTIVFGQVGINTSNPNNKSALEVVSQNNNTGILIPRLTTLQRDAIGTCSNSTDNYGGASFCNAGWANWRPHSFNTKLGNYEGRIVQYRIK